MKYRKKSLWNLKTMGIIATVALLCLLVVVNVTPREADSTSTTSIQSLAPTFPQTVQRYSKEIIQVSSEFDFDPNLIASMVTVESCGNCYVISNAGARGLIQPMPDKFGQGDNWTDPVTNLQRGLAYLAQARNRYPKQIDLWLAYYNGGPGAVNPNRRSQQTWDYIRYVGGIYQCAKEGKSGDDCAILQEWMIKGGSRLCECAKNNCKTLR